MNVLVHDGASFESNLGMAPSLYAFKPPGATPAAPKADRPSQTYLVVVLATHLFIVAGVLANEVCRVSLTKEQKRDLRHTMQTQDPIQEDTMTSDSSEPSK
jgi:hypothetical protein